MKYILLILLFTYSTVKGQNDNPGGDERRYTENDIANQGLFIKATQKKLIGKLDEAIEIYEGILEKDINNTVALFDLSRIYLEKDQKDEAITYGKKALKKGPRSLWYKESLAEILMHYGEFDQAAKLYNQLIAVDNSNYVMYYIALEAYRRANNEEGMLSIIQKIEKNFGPDNRSIQETTRILLNQGKNKEALVKAEKLLSLYPNDPEFIALNAKLQEDFGSTNKALSLYKSLLKQDPGNSEALVFIARQSGSNDDLEKLEIIAANPSVIIDSKIKALIPYAEKVTSRDPQKDRLINIANKIIELHSDEAKGYAILGDILNNTDNPELAEIQYLKALKIDKSVFAIWQQLMIIQYELGKYESLSSSSEMVLNYYPNQASPYIYNGLANVELDKFEEANDMLQEAEIIGSRDTFVISHLKLLSGKLTAHDNGEDIKEMTKEEIHMIGLKPNDIRILMVLKSGNYLVRVQKGS